MTTRINRGLALLLLATLTLSFGCSSSSSKPTTSPEPKDTTTGPNGGLLTEWGRAPNYAEIVVPTEEKGDVVIYMLDKDKKPMPIDEKAEVSLRIKYGKKTDIQKLKPSKQKDDPQGKVSAFSGSHEEFKDGLDLDAEQVEIIIKVGGKEHTSEFEGPPTSED